LTVYEAS